MISFVVSSTYLPYKLVGRLLGYHFIPNRVGCVSNSIADIMSLIRYNNVNGLGDDCTLCVHISGIVSDLINCISICRFTLFVCCISRV